MKWAITDNEGSTGGCVYAQVFSLHIAGVTMVMKKSVAEYIHSVEDLLENKNVVFGMKGGGTTYNFFAVINIIIT